MIEDVDVGVDATWKPSASVDRLHQRAKLIAKIRDFFAKKNIIEVETPSLSRATVTDIHIQSISATVKRETVFLQTSPEYAMKRLLAAGVGDVYQICKAFRQDEIGQWHNPEFTMLEWYRLGFDHHDLMNEIDELLRSVLSVQFSARYSYAEIFEKYLAINPHEATVSELKQCSKKNNIDLIGELSDRDAWLSLLMSHCIEPQLAKDNPVFIYDFPASQAALAQIRHGNPPVASRFELYFKGIELANGFHELLDAKEQRKRFAIDLQYRKEHGLPVVPMDELFLAALHEGLPSCAGVALGIDRLIMLALGCHSVAEVLSFSYERA